MKRRVAALLLVGVVAAVPANRDTARAQAGKAPEGRAQLVEAPSAGPQVAKTPVSRSQMAKAPITRLQAAKSLPPMWIGVFDPQLPAHAPWSNAKRTPVLHGGTVRVLAPESGAPAAGDVVIVHPLLGKVASGKVDRGTVALAEFAFDQRDGDDGVLVLPGGTAVAFVAPTRAEVTAIKNKLVRTDALAGVSRSLTGLELAGVDLDGDRKADVVATYGCTAWFDGSCQSRGQFFLVRRGARWTIVE